MKIIFLWRVIQWNIILMKSVISKYVLIRRWIFRWILQWKSADFTNESIWKVSSWYWYKSSKIVTGRPQMTSATFSGFFTPFPLISTKFMQPPFLPLFWNCSSPLSVMAPYDTRIRGGSRLLELMWTSRYSHKEEEHKAQRSFPFELLCLLP